MMSQDIYNMFKCFIFLTLVVQTTSGPFRKVASADQIRNKSWKNMYFSIWCKGHGMLMYFGLNGVAKGKVHLDLVQYESNIFSTTNGVSSVPYPWSKLGGLEGRFKLNCLFKNGGVERQTSCIPKNRSGAGGSGSPGTFPQEVSGMVAYKALLWKKLF